ncbi:MAG: cytochrome C oxidase subunit II [Paenisporosarcina sp.]
MSKQKHSADINLKGTLVSVFAVGIIIIAMWVIVYLMYVAR